MSTHRVPLDHTQTNIIVDVNGRPINVIVADVRPGEVPGEAAYISYMLDPESDRPVYTSHSDTAKDQFVATLSGKATFAEMIEATDYSLRLIANDGFGSATIPLTGLLSRRLGMGREMMLTAALLGVREFTDLLREKDYAFNTSEIIIAAGADVLQAWREEKNVSLRQIFGERPENEEEGSIIPLVQPAKQPDDIQRRWLELIGEFLSDSRQSQEGQVSRSSQQRHLTVVFEADTGSPISVMEHVSPLKLEGLDPGEAAVDVEYVEVNKKAMIIVGKNIVGNIPSQPSQEIMEPIREIRSFAPIFPPKTVAAEPAEAAVPDATDYELIAANDAVVRQMLEHVSDTSETSAHEQFVSAAAAMKLAAWWANRSILSLENLHDMIVERLWSQKSYTFSVDESGRFVGGIRQNVPSKAVNVKFRTYKDPQSGLHRIPVDFGWQGPKGKAFDAFSSWYRAKFFLEARETMELTDMLTETMFQGKPPYERVCSLIAHIAAKQNDRKKVAMVYNRVNGFPEKMDYQFEMFTAGLMRIAMCESKMNAKKEVRIAFLEMAMRIALGDDAVNDIIWKRGESPEGSDSGSAPSSGSTAGSPVGGGVGMKGAETKGDPRQMAYRWLEMIRDKIAKITRGPINPAMSTRRLIDLNIIFDPVTGEPKSIHEGVLLPGGVKPKDDAAIKIEYVEDGRRTWLTINYADVNSMWRVSNEVYDILRALKEMPLSTVVAPDPAPAQGGPESSPASGKGGTNAPAGGNGTNMTGAARFGEPYGWREHMAPPPARECKGIVREQPVPAGEEETARVNLSKADVAAMMAAEQDFALRSSMVSAETFLIATAPVAQA